jgi:hypothetical protein
MKRFSSIDVVSTTRRCILIYGILKILVHHRISKYFGIDSDCIGEIWRQGELKRKL